VLWSTVPTSASVVEKATRPSLASNRTASTPSCRPISRITSKASLRLSSSMARNVALSMVSLKSAAPAA